MCEFQQDLKGTILPQSSIKLCHMVTSFSSFNCLY